MLFAAVKTLFARHGIPEIFRSDTGPQYSAEVFTRFMKSYDIQHVTSSPRYPKSNGQAERTVQTVKHILRKLNDPYLPLLSYRATPLPWCNLSPSELLMGRRLRTTLSQTTHHLIPKWPYLPEFKRADKQHKDRIKEDFDRRHRVHFLPEIPDDQDVWLSSEGAPVPGTVMSPARISRSYIVYTAAGEICRNRSHLCVMPETTEGPLPSRLDHYHDQPRS